VPGSLGCHSGLFAGYTRRFSRFPKLFALLPDGLERLAMLIADFPRLFSETSELFSLVPRRLRCEALFFGEPTAFPTIAANLARVSGAPIVVAAVTRERDNTFRGVALPPIFVQRTKQAAHDIEHTTQAIVHGLEQLVRLDPDQWYIFRPMWTRPEGTV